MEESSCIADAAPSLAANKVNGRAPGKRHDYTLHMDDLVVSPYTKPHIERDREKTTTTSTMAFCP